MNCIIQKRRRELNLTQEELGNKIGVSSKVISKWETAKSIPDTALLKPLAKALEISVSDLLEANSQEEMNVLKKS